jgi:DNA-binding transcriptional regulator/RsmH inhibitor MraZ
MVLSPRLSAALATCTTDGSVIVARHPADPCLRLHNHAFADRLDERLRAREDASDGPSDTDAVNRRRLLAFAEEVPFGADGAISLSPMMRKQGSIGDHALLVCTGDTIEIWDPAVARATGDALLIALADHYQPLASA